MSPVLEYEQEDLTREEREELRRLVSNAHRTLALIGFPNSGKTAYLMALGKVLRGEHSNGRWRIQATSQDVFKYVMEELQAEHADRAWRPTETHRPPRALNLFSARLGWLGRRRVSAFDTSGEMYRLLVSGQPTPRQSLFLETLRRDVLPNSPGMAALCDSSLTGNRLAGVVNQFCILFNQVHPFDKGWQKADVPHAEELRRSWDQRFPLAFILTKMDLLKGREIRLSKAGCAYWQYIQNHSLSPAKAGMTFPDDNTVIYRIRTNVLLDEKGYPDSEEAHAIAEDYVNCCMPALADLIARMRHSRFYDVKVFGVSAWGRELPCSESGESQRPQIEDIAPARVLDPLFWLLDRTHSVHKRRAWTRHARTAAALLAAALLLGPGVFWGLYGLSRYLQKDHPRLTYYALAANYYHPYTRWAAPRWEPALHGRLAQVSLEVIDGCRSQRPPNDALAAKVKRLAWSNNANTRQLDMMEYAYQEKRFVDRSQTATLAETVRMGIEWIHAADRLGPEWLSEAVEKVASKLEPSEKGGQKPEKPQYDQKTWESLAKELEAYLGTPGVAGYHNLLRARIHLEDKNFKDAMRFARGASKYHIVRECEDAIRSVQEETLEEAQKDAFSAVAEFHDQDLAGALDKLNAVSRDCPSLSASVLDATRDIARKVCDKTEGWLKDDSKASPRGDENSIQPSKLAEDEINEWEKHVKSVEEIHKVVQAMKGLSDNPHAILGEDLGSSLVRLDDEISVERVVAHLRLAVAWSRTEENPGAGNETSEITNAVQQAEEADLAEWLADYPEKEKQVVAAIRSAANAGLVDPEHAEVCGVPSQQLEEMTSGFYHNCLKQAAAANDLETARSRLKQASGHWAKIQPGQREALASEVRRLLVTLVCRFPDISREEVRNHGLLDWQYDLIRAEVSIEERDANDALRLIRGVLQDHDASKADEGDAKDRAITLLCALFAKEVWQPASDPNESGVTEDMMSTCEKVRQSLVLADRNDLADDVKRVHDHLQKTQNMAYVHGNPGFYIDRHEVTCAQYREASSKHLPETVDGNPYDTYYRVDPPEECAVMGVTQDEAKEFAEKQGKRLPRKREYEAIRAELDKAHIGKVKEGIIRADACDEGEDHGVLGILGNVREWCYESGWVYGHSWSQQFNEVKSQRPPGTRSSEIGFRCAMDLLPDGVDTCLQQKPATGLSCHE